MNREIKFRVYNKKTKKWIHGPGEEANLLGERILFGGFLKKTPICEYDYLKVLQFTGLRDKHGREVYEGDVVYDRNSSCVTDKSMSYFLVVHDETYSAFVLRKLGVPFYSWNWIRNISSEGMVVGNAFEERWEYLMQGVRSI